MSVYQQLTHGEIVPSSSNTREIVKAIRQKLGDNFVETVRGEGYIIGTNTTSWVDMDRGTVFKGKESE